MSSKSLERVQNKSSKRDPDLKHRLLTNENLWHTELRVIKLLQEEVFTDELKVLSTGMPAGFHFKARKFCQGAWMHSSPNGVKRKHRSTSFDLSHANWTCFSFQHRFSLHQYEANSAVKQFHNMQTRVWTQYLNMYKLCMGTENVGLILWQYTCTVCTVHASDTLHEHWYQQVASGILCTECLRGGS